MSKKASGTFEWAERTANLYSGCSNNCRYCYARHDAVNRFHTKTAEDWTRMELKKDELHRLLPKFEGRYMFPTRHDITIFTAENCIHFLKNNLQNGARFLIVTKPSSDVVRHVCAALDPFKDQIMWRFTIGGMSDVLLEYWEPNAPRFPERVAALASAWRAGFQTSVSMEPLLQPDALKTMLDVMLDYVTDGIWLGPMNRIEQRVERKTPEDDAMVKLAKALREPEVWKRLHANYGQIGKIRWKNEAKEILGLPLNEKAGEDK